MYKWMIALVSLAGLLVAQATFSTETRLVLMDVIVRTDAGPVEGLTRDDFVIEDKGKKQDISVFEMVRADDITSVQPGLNPVIASNRLNRAGETQKTATVVLYDRTNTAADDQAFIRKQVLELLSSLTDEDRIGFYSIGFNLAMVTDYNEPSGRLGAMAKRLQDENKSTEGLSEQDQALLKALDEALTPMQQLANQARVNIMQQAFRTLGRHMVGIPGRKNLLWITSGFPLTFGNAPERRRNDEREVQYIQNLLTENNISIYPTDPAGAGTALDTPYEESTEGQLLEERGTQLIRTNIASSLTGIQTLLRLADKTGGKVYRNANDIRPALEEVLGLTEVTYTLGFYADTGRLDNKVHELKVELKESDRTQDAEITYRKEYLAWTKKNEKAQKELAELFPPSPIAELVNETLDATAVELMAVANPDPNTAGNQKVDIRVQARDLAFEQRGDMYVGSFNMAVVVAGAKGGSVKTYPMELSSDQFTQVTQGGINVSESVPAPGATGRIRVVLEDQVSGAVGSLWVSYAPQ